jgi:hypothetical protein
VMIGQRLREVAGVVRDARLHGFGTVGRCILRRSRQTARVWARPRSCSSRRL